ncbi:MAG: polysaccharide deacetylase family protein [Planctomycetes bacterium]|nr:polysaccharide deacetylase family protein [Planctomycetota bacterium]
MSKLKWILLVSLVLTNSSSAQKNWIRINQLGYTPNSVKVAVLASKETASINSFEIVDVLTEKTAFRSQDIKTYSQYAAFQSISRLDFSSFKGSGTFYIKAANITSPHFRIADDIYNHAADFLLKYLRQQRCGYNPFLKDTCHTHDGFIVDHPELEMTHIDVTGGWHDATDYLQYVTTSANATHQMLFAFQQNPTAFADHFNAKGDPGANGIPDILDEAKWGLDWLDKMNPQPGVMFNQIADDRDHAGFRLPTDDTDNYGKGLEPAAYPDTGKPQGLAQYKNRTTGVSSTAAKYASAFALGADLLQKHYPEFSRHISQKALDAYQYAQTDLGVCQTASNRAPYFYEEDNYVDDLELAAIQLHRLTRDPNYLSDAVYWGSLEPVTPWMSTNTARHYQWYPFVNLGHYYIAQNAAPAEKEKFIEYLRQGIEQVNQRAQQNGFYMGIPYIWCSNNLVAALLTQIRCYHQLTGDNTYQHLEAAMRDWLFGCNPWGTSMIVGYPADADTPTDPHSSFTVGHDYKIDGGLVDGPIYTSTFNQLIGLTIVNGDEYAQFQSDLCVYHDDYGDYSTNEPTTDGTASLTFYLSALAHQTTTQSPNYTYNQGGIIRGDQSTKNIHLIFTGHQYSDGSDIIQQTLKSHQIKAHFFFTGDFYRNPKHTQLIHQLKNDGHYLGAHSDKHLLYAPWEDRNKLLITKNQFIQDLSNNYQEMARFNITKQNAPLFLPPFEWYNTTISDWTNQLNLTLINFTSGTTSNADYTTPDLGDRYQPSQKIYDKILSYEKNSPNGLNGFLLLLHIGTHPDRTDKFYHKLDNLLTELKKRGYQFTLFSL